MSTKTQNKGLTVEEGRTKLHSTHNGERLTFVHPEYGPNTYANVGQQIQEAGLRKPTMAETASLVYDAFNSDDKYSKGIRETMKNRWLWGFTGTLYVPGEGAYIQDDPETREGMPFMDHSELVEKLEAGDPSVRHVPFGFQTGTMSTLELSRNAYIKALAGEEGAEKLAEVAERHKGKPYLWSFESVSRPATRVSGLNSGWDLGDHRLGVGGSDRGGRDGYAFGVQEETGEASRAEK
tara:strand:- start:19860 stop:20570 length:711 start_codon:yes stop_codon:yes gene_type:complete